MICETENVIFFLVNFSVFMINWCKVHSCMKTLRFHGMMMLVENVLKCRLLWEKIKIKKTLA